MDKIKTFLKLAVHPKNWDTLYKEYKELIRYIFFGVLTTIVSFASYYIIRVIFPSAESVPGFLSWLFNITAAFGIESATVLPVVVSWICSVTFAYVTNRLWVFESKAKGFPKVAVEALSFYGSRVATLFVDMLIMFLLVDLTGINNPIYEFFAKIFSNIFVLVLNYILSKVFVFRKKK